MRSRFITQGLVAGLITIATAGLGAGVAQAASWLGVYTQEITPELREGIDYNGAGVLIRSVVRNSPADDAGLQRGDVIVRVGSREVRSPSDLSSTIRDLTPGRSVAIEIVRNGRRRAIDTTLEERPSGSYNAPEADDDEDNDEDYDNDRDNDRWERRVPAPPTPRVHIMTPDAPDAPEAPLPPDFLKDLGDLGNLSMIGRGRLGVRIESLSPDLASYFGGREVRGALVVDVTEGSAADKAGIRAGDVITRVNSTTVTDADDLVGAIRDSDRDASITLIRHGSRQTVEARLGQTQPDIMRFRGMGPEGFQWRNRDGKRVREFNWNDGGNRRTPRRIVIQGDGEGDEDLKKELDDLREELRQLREDLRDNR